MVGEIGRGSNGPIKESSIVLLKVLIFLWKETHASPNFFVCSRWDVGYVLPYKGTGCSKLTLQFISAPCSDVFPSTTMHHLKGQTSLIHRTGKSKRVFWRCWVEKDPIVWHRRRSKIRHHNNHQNRPWSALHDASKWKLRPTTLFWRIRTRHDFNGIYRHAQTNTIIMHPPNLHRKLIQPNPMAPHREKTHSYLIIHTRKIIHTQRSTRNNNILFVHPTILRGLSSSTLEMPPCLTNTNAKNTTQRLQDKKWKEVRANETPQVYNNITDRLAIAHPHITIDGYFARLKF